MDIRALPVDSFLTFTLAIVLLFIGKRAVSHFALLKRYSIPDPVIGGLSVQRLRRWCITRAASRWILMHQPRPPAGPLRRWACADLRMLISGGKPLVILLVFGFACLFSAEHYRQASPNCLVTRASWA